MKVLDVPPTLRRGALRGDLEEYVHSGRMLIDLLCRRMGVEDLGSLRVLDMGCGTKLVQAFLAYDLPVGAYVGIDIYRAMIEFLDREVQDPRFSFHHMNSHNAMYNPGGVALGPDTSLPVTRSDFDLICLFSVFTHLEPHDYVAMLKLLRPYIRPGGMLLFSLFVNELTAGGHGLIDGVHHTLQAEGGSGYDTTAAPDFVDTGPGTLQWALYSRKHAMELVQGTGWRVESLNDPEEYVQHYFVCRPD